MCVLGSVGTRSERRSQRRRFGPFRGTAATTTAARRETSLWTGRRSQRRPPSDRSVGVCWRFRYDNDGDFGTALHLAQTRLQVNGTLQLAADASAVSVKGPSWAVGGVGRCQSFVHEGVFVHEGFLFRQTARLRPIRPLLLLDPPLDTPRSTFAALANSGCSTCGYTFTHMWVHICCAGQFWLQHMWANKKLPPPADVPGKRYDWLLFQLDNGWDVQIFAMAPHWVRVEY